MFIEDFYKNKYEDFNKKLVGEPDLEYNKALEDYANEAETRSFISRKTFYLRYRTVYGATHEEAMDFIPSFPNVTNRIAKNWSKTEQTRQIAIKNYKTTEGSIKSLIQAQGGDAEDGIARE